jgi:REP element-mobilizing transposase RayT
MTYLLTFCCYGAHLPGDARGWVERTRGEHRGKRRDPSESLERYARSRMCEDPYLLNRQSAATVSTVIQEVCSFRQWHLRAAHVRTNHVHCVVDDILHPNPAIADFKAYSSRVLNRTEGERKRWARAGSARRLVNVPAIQAAMRYVADKQGEPMAVYVAQRKEECPAESPLLRVRM